ncbi:MAG TPA: hypothetical protein P5571_03690 [Candidatus Krumholzibacteria bacterium]|nr:hypothetical protein [Candidatus Krumholzibacteria bacterium]HRX50443.1 hypothetical protein [Candidatus Krumholzibacteria bacterium]
MARFQPRHLLAAVAVTLIVAAFVAPPGGDDPGGPAAFFAFCDAQFSSWFGILAVFAFLLGGVSLVGTHLRRVLLRERDWTYSIVTLVSFLGVLVVGLAKLGGAPGLQGDPFAPDAWLTKVFDGVLSPLHATLYSLLAFYVASASYRAFRARSLETSVLLGSALVVLVGRIPSADRLTAWLPADMAFLRLEALSLWLLKVPNTAGQRAIMIGVALGVVSLAVRMIAGVERGKGGLE